MLSSDTILQNKFYPFRFRHVSLELSLTSSGLTFIFNKKPFRKLTWFDIQIQMLRLNENVVNVLPLKDIFCSADFIDSNSSCQRRAVLFN